MLDCNSVKNANDFTTLKSTEKGYCKFLGNIKEIRKLKTLSFMSLVCGCDKAVPPQKG